MLHKKGPKVSDCPNSQTKQEGINSDSVQADLPIPMVATRDIADAAATALKSRDWNGVVVRELLGPRDLS
jgi:hypothetical protein